MNLATLYKLKDLNIDTLKFHLENRAALWFQNPGGELFQHPDGFFLDIQSINLLVTIYDALNEKNKKTFNSVFADEYIFANLLDKMIELIN